MKSEVAKTSVHGRRRGEGRPQGMHVCYTQQRAKTRQTHNNVQRHAKGMRAWRPNKLQGTVTCGKAIGDACAALELRGVLQRTVRPVEGRRRREGWAVGGQSHGRRA